MPIFTAIAFAVSTSAFGIAAASAFGVAASTIGAVAAFAARTLIMIGVSQLLVDRGSGTVGTSSTGARVQLPPATNNKIPVVYGNAYIAPVITDAMLSTDQTTMWYVCSLAEATSGTISFGDIYWGGRKLNFDTVDLTKVISWTTNADPPQTDTKVNGLMNIYCYNAGSSAPTNTAQTAIQVLQDAAIPVANQWTATDLMSECAFIIIKLVYNQNAGLTGLDQITVEINNSLNEPGAVILDYFTNVRYGCGLPLASIDTANLVELDAYSNELIGYVPAGGGPTQLQARYRVNGPINTGSTCLVNLQQLVDTCDSWLQYSEQVGQWRVIINRSYLDYTTTPELFLCNDDNIIGGIDINPTDLNNTYNQVEVQYPNVNILDQTDYQLIVLDPLLMAPNEPINILTLQFLMVNNAVQAKYLATRTLTQNREDLAITFTTDYSGIQVQAGDVIRITYPLYGWTEKLWRVAQVSEAMAENFLGARIACFEYNETVYLMDPIHDYVPAANTGLVDPTIIGNVTTPTVAYSPLTNGNVQSLTITATVPTTGITMNVDFNYGTTTDVAQHVLYKTVSTNDGTPFVAGDTVTMTMTDLPPGTYYWSTVPRNTTAAATSIASSSIVWTGPNITAYNPATGEGGVSVSQLPPGSTVAQWTAAWETEFSNGVFVDITTTEDRTGPMYIPSTTAGPSVPSTKYWPFAQGTSSLADYYAADSTGTYAPGPASYLNLDNPPAGWQGWYKLIKADVSNSYNEAGSLYYNYSHAIISNTPNAIIQIAPYGIVNISPYMQVTTSGLASYVLNVQTPYAAISSVGALEGARYLPNPSGGIQILEFGMAVRCLTPGAVIKFVACGLQLRQTI
jgi:hypothetical protein